MRPNLLHDNARAGLYHLPAARRKGLPDLATKGRLALLPVAADRCRNVNEALHQFGRALGFPAWYGGNLDALHDCLTDPDWHPKRGVVVLITGLDAAQHGDPARFATLLAVLRSAAASRSADGKPLWILLDAPAPGVLDLPEA
jgi:RNAse (barnase) inhibitor barstar